MLDGVADMRAAEQGLVEEAVEVHARCVSGAEIRLHEYVRVEHKGVGVPVRLDAGAAGLDNIQIRVEGQAVDNGGQNIMAGSAAPAVRDMDGELYLYSCEAAVFVLYQHTLVVFGEAVHYFHLPYAHGDGDAL